LLISLLGGVSEKLFNLQIRLCNKLYKRSNFTKIFIVSIVKKHYEIIFFLGKFYSNEKNTNGIYYYHNSEELLPVALSITTFCGELQIISPTWEWIFMLLHITHILYCIVYTLYTIQ